LNVYLQNTEKPILIKSLVDSINDIIINKYLNFEFIENVLKYPSMKDVLVQFRESDVFIRACKNPNSSALRWLMKMDINPGNVVLFHAKYSLAIERICKDW